MRWAQRCVRDSDMKQAWCLAAFRLFFFTVSQTSGVARPCSVTNASMMVALLSASKSVQSIATAIKVRMPTV